MTLVAFVCVLSSSGFVLAEVEGAGDPGRPAVSSQNLPPGLTAEDWTEIAAKIGGTRAASDPLATTETRKLKASDAAEEDYFGAAVAIDGDTVVVGATGHDAAGGDAGAAYVFRRNLGGEERWSEVAKLEGSEIDDEDYFGSAVAVDGDTIAVGAIGSDYEIDEECCEYAGKVYVFCRNEGGMDAWGEVAVLTATDIDEYYEFGSAVAISQDLLVVGTPYDFDAGAAYVFSRNEGGIDAWGVVAKLISSDIAYDDFFGNAVAVDGEIVVVGARDAGVGGAAYVFSRNGGIGQWGQVAKLEPSDPTISKRFGDSVGVSEETVIVGASGDGVAEPNAGAAYFFERNQGGTADAWGQVAKITASQREAGALMGETVAISEDMAVVGASSADIGANTDVGLVYILRRNLAGADSWAVTETVEASNSAPGVSFGRGLAMSCGTIIAGSVYDDEVEDDSGAAFIIEHDGDHWLEGEKVVAGDIAADDHFGYSIDISGDTLVVGKPNENEATGSAYVFTRNLGGADFWQQVVKLVPAELEAGDAFGYSVAVDGDTAVIGAYLDDDSGDWKGSAYIFQRNQGGPDDWGRVKKISPEFSSSWDFFGKDVAISGDTVAVGAEGYNVPLGQADIGAAYIFERNFGGADNWGERILIENPEPFGGDFFGGSIDVDNDTLVVGCYWDGVPEAGAAFVFDRNQGGADTWGQVGYLVHPGTRSDGDRFGWSVAVEDDTIVVGSVNWGASDYGSAVVYQRNEGGADAWGDVAVLDAPDHHTDHFLGHEVDIACGTIVVSAYGDDHAGDHSGAAYLYRRNAGGANVWGEVAKITAADTVEGDWWGQDVVISCEHVAVSSSEDTHAAHDEAGSTTIFDLQRSDADLSITKTNNTSAVAPGGSMAYDVTIANGGPDDVVRSMVTDVLDSTMIDIGTVSWTCSPDAGAGPGTSCPGSGAASDLDFGVPVDLESGDSVTMTINATIKHGVSGTLVNTAVVKEPIGVHEVDTIDNAATDSDTILELDFGDAPDPTGPPDPPDPPEGNYPTVIASDGAAHGIVTGFHLGALIDADDDGQKSSNADGDDGDGTDDEDGVVLASLLLPGQQATIQVTASSSGLLDGWFDSNRDGDWDDPGEQVFASTPLSAGSNTLNFVLDPGVSLGFTFMRFRFSSAGGLSPAGVAHDGEVEDYRVEVEEALAEPLIALAATAGDGENTIYWKNPGAGYRSTLIVACPTDPPAGPTDPCIVFTVDEVQDAGGDYSMIHGPLDNHSTWHYAGWTYNGDGDISSVLRVSARPQEMTGPVKWIYSTGASSLAPPAILPGGIYHTVSNDRKLHAMSWDTGGWPAGWKTPSMNAPAQGRPPVLNLPMTTIEGKSSVVFAGSQDGRVYTFDALTGDQLRPPLELGAPGAMIQAAPSVMFTDFGAPFNLLIAATWDTLGSAVYGIDVATGDVVWTFDDAGAGIGVISTQPSIDYSVSPPRLYFASRARTSGSPTVWCLEFDHDPHTVVELWSEDVGDTDGTAIPWNGKVYLGNNAGEVHALDADTGAALWSSPWTTDDGPVKQVVWPDAASGRLYFSTTNRVQAVTDTGAAAEGFWGVLSWTEEHKLTASDGEGGDGLGGRTGVALDGDTAVIGAFGVDGPGLNSGAAYVFGRHHGGSDSWGEVATLVANDGAGWDYFGGSVSVSGDTAAVSAYSDDDLGDRSGSVYVFYRDNGGADQWGQVAKIVADDGAAIDFFGYSLSIDGENLVVGALGNDDLGNQSGSAYVFNRNLGGSDAWGEVKKLLAGDGVASDYFGWAVAVDGTTAVVSAPNQDPGGTSNAGAAYVFERDYGGGDNWGQVEKLTASNGMGSDYFGESVAINGDVIVIGAHQRDDPHALAGAAYVFERNAGGPGQWGQTAYLVADDLIGGDYFGSSVGVSGGRIVVGAPEHGNPETRGGAAYVFRKDPESGAWNQDAKLTSSDIAASDYLGRSCAVSGSTVVVGADGDDDVENQMGSAYIFEAAGTGFIPGPSHPVVVDGRVYVGGGDGRLYQMDADEAAPVPVIISLGDPTVDKAIGAPGFDVQEGRVVVGSDQGRIYAVEVPLP